MLQLASGGQYWSGAKAELNMSFDNLLDYQWTRLLKALWSSPKISGPFEKRYLPNEPEPPKVEPMTPEPTATFSQFGAYEFSPEVRVGIEVLVTRSLFECVSVLIPLNMFANVQPQPNDPGLQIIEKAFYDLAVRLYETTTFDIAAIGVNRGCQLMVEMLSSPEIRSAFLSAGNFLARDDTLAGLRVEPKTYQEVMPSLRWCPPKR